MRKHHLTGATVALSLITAGCVPTVSVENATCPCPSGYICCASNNRCIENTRICDVSNGHTCDDAECNTEVAPWDSTSGDTGALTDTMDTESGTSPELETESVCEGETCPAAVSSNAPCRTDGDCPSSHEVCLTWQDDQQNPKGPAVCRQTCTGRCPEGEICELVLHDAKPLSAVHVETACIARKPEPGCAEVGCNTCENPPYGSTVCNTENAVEGCFIALDAACGIYCRTVEIESCDDSACIEDDTGAYCELSRSDPYDQWCELYACDETCSSEPPGSAVCENGTTHACVRLVLPKRPCTDDATCVCDALCRPLTLGSCD